MIAEFPGQLDRRTARYLVALWVGSVVTVSALVAYYELPVDIDFRWWSVQGFEMIGVLSAFWLVSGLVVGGWKLVLVATGVSSIRTTTDKTLIAMFALWTLAYPVLAIWSAVNLGLI